MKIIYLANNYGFSRQQEALLTPIKDALVGMGLKVYEPFERNNSGCPPYSDYDLWQVGKSCTADIRYSDAVLGVVNGEAPDVGVAYELGYAHALGKEIFLLRDDFRMCSDGGCYPINLMFFSSFVGGRIQWRKHYYIAVEELSSKNKALYRWANDIKF